MEILKGYQGTVRFPVPADLPSATFTVSKDGVQLGQPGNAVLANGVASVTVPYSASTSEGTVDVTLRFVYESGVNTITKSVDIVTPYLDIWELKAIIDDEEFNDKEYWEIEASVRHIINAHTGQSFGKYVGKKTIYGEGQDALSLPSRLISVKEMTGYPYPDFLVIKGDGWYLEKKSAIGAPDVRADFDGYNIASSDAPIRYPFARTSLMFRSNQKIVIDGEWGWNDIPAPVREAARLLANDYAGDTLYRDRYLVSMTAADWRIQFTNGAFAKTGNVRADQLLSDYVLKRGWAVL